MTNEQPMTPRSRRNRDLDRVIGKRLRDIRLSGGVSQEELAERLGIERVSLSRYETGQRAVPFSTLMTISEVLQRPIGDFLPGAQQPVKRGALLPSGPTDSPAIEEIVTILTQHPQFTAGVQQFLNVMLQDDTEEQR